MPPTGDGASVGPDCSGACARTMGAGSGRAASVQAVRVRFASVIVGSDWPPDGTGRPSVATGRPSVAAGADDSGTGAADGRQRISCAPAPASHSPKDKPRLPAHAPFMALRSLPRSYPGAGAVRGADSAAFTHFVAGGAGRLPASAA